MASTSKEIGAVREVTALNYISRFGWLRSAELGKLLFPYRSSANAKKAMSKVLTRLRKKKCVLERRLPDGLGLALVLAKAGVARLAENNIEAKSGKDWGTFNGNDFIPPATFKHDLLVAGFLSSINPILTFLTEKEIVQYLERNNLVAQKIPDALVALMHQDKAYSWVEVESTRKTGKNLAAMIRASVTAARGCDWHGFNLAEACIVYDKDAKTELGHALNHRLRIANKIRTHSLTEDVTLSFCEMTRVGGSVQTLKFEDELFKRTSTFIAQP
jgi:hypothetical protein